MAELGPITAALEQEVLGELRRQGIVVWLDRDGSFAEYVDRLVERAGQGDFAYPVVAFRGSYLETMLALEELEAGLDPTPLLVHMPGFTEDAMRATPLLELYRAGTRYRRALDTLVRETAAGKAPPEEIERFLARKDRTLGQADEWLAAATNGSRQGLAAFLDGISLDAMVRELLVQDTFLAGRMDRNRPEDLDALRAWLERKVGMSGAWLAFVRGRNPGAAEAAVLVDALQSWILCVEYVDDLLRPPSLDELKPLRHLPKAIVKACREQARALRDQHPERYETIARVVEDHLDQELPAIKPEDLGRIDTFQAEEAVILGAAVAALAPGGWQKARDWAADRAVEGSFWVRRDQGHRTEWNLVSDAAALGSLLEERPRPLAGVATFEEALERYAKEAAEVDRAHRRFEQRGLTLYAQLPHFAELKGAQARLRQAHGRWADDLARDFSALCRSKGLLPAQSLQQRTLYDEVVHPLVRGGEKTALFLVDALRYEMATHLAAAFAAPGTKVTLAARLAELPTVTEVGMNALAPIATNGTLTLAGSAGLCGFKAGELTVSDPESRARAMGQRSTTASFGKPLWLGLAEVCESDQATLRNRVAQKQLVVVADAEIDRAGEAGVGLATFEQTLGQIEAAWHRLESAGVKQAVITADHGFLLVDATAPARPYGKKTDPGRRYVLAAERRVERGLLTVSFAELGYEGRAGWLLFPEDTTVFDQGDRRKSFVHGGNSPQERIVPVITISSTGGRSVDLGAYRVVAEAEPDALGCHRMRVRLVLARGAQVLEFVRAEPVALAIRVADGPGVAVVVREVTGPGAGAGMAGGRLVQPPDAPWSEVFFTLEGPEDGRARVEVYHPDGLEQVEPCTPEAWFAVTGAARAVAPAGATKAKRPSLEPPPPEGWAAALPDDGTRRIFVHLWRHGSITEAEATDMLGSARAFRRFSQKLEGLAALTPLRVRIESTAEGAKRYVTEGNADGT